MTKTPGKIERRGGWNRAPLALRIERNSIPVPFCGCWIWMGSERVKGRGYGSIGIGKRVINTHRASWIAFRGPIPKGLHVLHDCDTPACVNPDHLFLGTNAENVADRVAKDRSHHGTGEANPNSKLEDWQVESIRKSNLSGSKLASLYGVSKTHINRIKRGDSWGLR